MPNTKKIPVFIDSCTWNYFKDRNYCLKTELPTEKFNLYMTKMVEDFEVDAIKDKDLTRYIKAQVELRNIKKRSMFGLGSSKDPPNMKHKVEGFDFGEFISAEEYHFYRRYQHYIDENKTKGSGLNSNEADVGLAVYAHVGNVVLTNESKRKKGPLKDAYNSRANVIFLEDFSPDKERLQDFIVKHIETKS